ncbi:hypothetical protein D030_3750A, partial [Vibrio parahaemolyticus AQ3810]
MGVLDVVTTQTQQTTFDPLFRL